MNINVYDNKHLCLYMFEQKLTKTRFTRVDGDSVENLIAKEDKQGETLAADIQEELSSAFKSQLPKVDKADFNIGIQALGENTSPIMITQSEYMRRMKEMANIQQGMSFYGEMPDMFNVILNSDHKLIKVILEDEEKSCKEATTPIQTEMNDVDKQRSELRKNHEGKKDEEIPTTEKDQLKELDNHYSELKKKKEAIYGDYASTNKVIKQLIDLALLQNGMLKGEALSKFVQRSIELI